MAKARKRAKKPLKKRAAKKAAKRTAKKARRKAGRKAVRAKRPAKKAARKAARAKRPAKKPAVKLPALPPIEGYVRSLPPPVKPIVATLRRIVREAAPEARELFVENAPAYEANGLFARIEAKDREVIMSFLRGSQLQAPEGVLVAGGGDERHVALHNLEEVRENVLRTLVRQAVLVNLGQWQGTVHTEPGAGAGGTGSAPLA